MKTPQQPQAEQQRQPEGLTPQPDIWQPWQAAEPGWGRSHNARAYCKRTGKRRNRGRRKGVR